MTEQAEQPTGDRSDAEHERQQAWDRQLEAQPTMEVVDYRRRSRRSFLGFGVAGVAAFMGFRHVQNRPESDNIPDVIRKGLEANESIWDSIGSDSRTARTFSISDREDIRVNGRIGIGDDIDPASWQVRIVGTGGDLIDTLDLDDIQQLPSHDIVCKHKCIEGWATTVHWTGARFSDLAARYYDVAVPRSHRYVSIRTPDDQYYVGLDRETVLHSQTLLAWALNGEPLSDGHGAPLRLAVPITYGIKQLKRIGTIEFTNTRPADYWAERGYDWHARF